MIGKGIIAPINTPCEERRKKWEELSRRNRELEEEKKYWKCHAKRMEEKLKACECELQNLDEAFKEVLWQKNIYKRQLEVSLRCI